jgi:imidazole glycerol-phosphate synthase subunit HisH
MCGVKVAIIDYELGNLRSVAGAVEKLGHEPIVSHDFDQLSRADKLILPGVGAFGDGMANLRRLRLIDPLTKLVQKEGRPILGICLGAQLMAWDSQEFGFHEGLGWVGANVVRLEPSEKSFLIPHVGWNDLSQIGPCILFEGVPESALFYYVHSFRIVCRKHEIVMGECDYGGSFTAVFQVGNIFGTQFHPEKSQLHGLKLLRNFIEKS